MFQNVVTSSKLPIVKREVCEFQEIWSFVSDLPMVIERLTSAKKYSNVQRVAYGQREKHRSVFKIVVIPIRLLQSGERARCV